MVVHTQEAMLEALTEMPQAETNRRPPPQYFCVLLPLWGESYITQFLEGSLLTLLADGNLPALARSLPTRFVFLTRKEDENTIRAHRAYLRLHRVCTVEFLPIDDLVMSGNHSTTITLAWERAVRREGEAMLDTCFVFLVSDYVMADGSLATIAERMLAGADAIQAGNFQLNEDVAAPWLQERIAAASGSLSLDAREMVLWGLGCLHPATLANTVNYPLYHNSHTNRLFWRVDRDTMIGRFYLLHQICIRPQRTDFVIGSASDYSFVAEMCPTGDVVILTDSDEYFVVEIQPLHHEALLIQMGPQSVDDLAACLSEWTNHQHRLNAEHTIVFHAADLSPALPAARADADQFIGELTLRLGKEQPLRNHPYWIGAIAVLQAAIAQRGRTVSAHVGTRAMHWLRSSIVGRVPYVNRLHPRRRDYRIMLAACEAIANSSSRLLIEVTDSTGLGEALREKVPGAVLFSLWGASPNQPIMGIDDTEFDAAFVGLVNKDPSEIEPRLTHLVATLRPGAQIVVATIYTDSFVHLDHARQMYATRIAALASAGLTVTECCISAMSWWRWWANGCCARAANQLVSRRRALAPLNCLRIALWAGPALVSNLVSSFWPQRSSPRGIVSSFLIRLTVGPEAHEALGLLSTKRATPLRDPVAAVNDMARYQHLFNQVTPWRGRVPPGYLVDFCGVITAAEVTTETEDRRFCLLVRGDGSRLVYTDLPTIADGQVWFEAANWVMAVREARKHFVMMTLGANYGARGVCCCRVLQQLNPMPCTLVAVEPVPEKYALMQRHFRDNGLDPADHWLLPYVVAANTEPVLFPVVAVGNNAQNGVASGYDKSRVDWGDGLTQPSHGATEATLRNFLPHNSRNLARPLKKDIDLTTGPKFVSAVTLRELLGPFTRVDYLESRIQQSEIDIFHPFMGSLREKVRRIHIATHGKDMHHALHKMFARDGWQIVFSFAPNGHHETVLGGFDTNDGILTMLNPNL